MDWDTLLVDPVARTVTAPVTGGEPPPPPLELVPPAHAVRAETAGRTSPSNISAAVRLKCFTSPRRRSEKMTPPGSSQTSDVRSGRDAVCSCAEDEVEETVTVPVSAVFEP